jgi:hypothetical protein
MINQNAYPRHNQTIDHNNTSKKPNENFNLTSREDAIKMLAFSPYR